MEIWQQILLSEESARRKAGGITHANQPQNTPPRPAPIQAPQTFIFERSNYNSTLPMIEVLNITGQAGVVEDFLVKAPSSDYTVELLIDGNKVDFRHTWAELNEMSQDIESVVAINRKGQYVASMSNMYFTNKITLRILATGITFKKIFAKVRFNGQ